MEEIKKTGIMGGTFNPIHQGHLLLAEQARDYCGLDEVLFIPSGNSYMKDASQIPEAKIRVDMTALAIEDNPFFALSTIETEREGATYTFETLKELKRLHPNTRYYFIIGADNLFSIERWKEPAEILKCCTIAAACRGEKSEEELMNQAAYLKEAYGAHVILLPSGKMDLSSSGIRERIKNGKSVRYMVPDKVLFYIEKNGLYGFKKQSLTKEG